MPKVTFIFKDGTQKTVEFEHGRLPYDGHGLPASRSSTPAAAAVPAPHAISTSARAPPT
jgi:hypothetical protein